MNRSISKSWSRVLLSLGLLLIPLHRLPAPIQEIAESPTPTLTPIREPISSVVPESGANPSLPAWQGEAFPETRLRRLTAQDVASWSAEKVRYAINELYARGGYDFRTPEVKETFMRLSWYRERLVNGRTQDEAYGHLSALEKSNLELLQAIRRGK
ncbi:MAG TPA: YARHG domain-containing protein [Chthoniobacterales bacterium]|nr:YARHG domain-containing protein [Chthoniobacterales bacterium]